MVLVPLVMLVRQMCDAMDARPKAYPFYHSQRTESSSTLLACGVLPMRQQQLAHVVQRIMRRMRIDLQTPFAEKDAAKALGARWDSSKRTWYIQNVADLAPFQRWIPAGTTAQTAGPVAMARQAPASAPARARAPSTAGGTITQSVTVLPHCGCAMLPWEPCIHHP